MIDDKSIQRIKNKLTQQIYSDKDYCLRRRIRIKATLFALYGNKCKKCGFNDVRALQIDHIIPPKQGNGENCRGGYSLYCAILKGKFLFTDFQLLCANCNQIKKIENQEIGNYRKLFVNNVSNTNRNRKMFELYCEIMQNLNMEEIKKIIKLLIS